MVLANVIISGRDWLYPAAGLFGVALLILWWAYRGGVAERWVRALCLILKLLGLGALALCLLEPLWSGQRAKPGANLFVILADNSQGMQIKDPGASQSRGEFMRKLLTDPAAGWLAKMTEDFDIRRYQFDSRVESTKDFGELRFEGRATSMAAALRVMQERFQGRPLAGILLLSDGNATDITGPPDWSGLPPVYPVLIGSDQPIKDLALQKVSVSQTSFEDAPVTIQADVAATGYSGENIVAQVQALAPVSKAGPIPDASGRRPDGTPEKGAGRKPVLLEQTQRAPRSGDLLTFHFQLRPEKPGLSFYHVRVAAKAEFGQFRNTNSSTEATLANNSRVVAVDRGRGPYRVLYVAGRPNWEYKFLQRAVTADDQIQLVALIRIAKREPKFDFRGRTGESSNPLFRGFDAKAEDTERYDQSVLVRLNTRDALELAGGFPKTAEELYAYHAVVLDDLESEFFTREQMTLLQKFVSERGGGFLMLGGQECFHQGKYERTPIGDMLPVYLDRAAEGKPASHLRLSLTREGWLQPWARLRNNETDERSRLEQMPPFQVLNKVRDIKPGANVMATVEDAASRKYPALAIQRFGRGRSAALLIGDMWRWGLKNETLHRDLDKAWRQLMRWLVTDVPNRIELQAEQKPGDPNQAVLLQVRARDKKFEPLDNASVTLQIYPMTAQFKADSKETFAAGTNSIRLQADPAASEAGLFQATYVPRETGGYRAEAIVTDAAGVAVGQAEAGWTSDPAAEEFRSLKPNRALLETIAQKTGGQMIDADQLENFANKLPNRKAPITEAWTHPLWHQPAVFLFALACFIAEWGLRRGKGLA